MDATAIKDWNIKVQKAYAIMDRLEKDPDNVSDNEFLFFSSMMERKPGDQIPMSTLRGRYKKIKANQKK